MQQETTVNEVAYCAFLTTLKRAIQNKQGGLQTAGVLLLHDNLRPHYASSTIHIQNMIRPFGWEHIDHLPYNLDKAPSEFLLSRYLKEFFGGNRLAWYNEVKEAV